MHFLLAAALPESRDLDRIMVWALAALIVACIGIAMRNRSPERKDDDQDGFAGM